MPKKCKDFTLDFTRDGLHYHVTWGFMRVTDSDGKEQLRAMDVFTNGKVPDEDMIVQVCDILLRNFNNICNDEEELKNG